MNSKKTAGHDANMFPVIKFSLDNQIIYHNVAAMPLLSQWNCELNKKVPSAIAKKHPAIFNSKNQDAKDISILYKEYVFSFSVIPFPEAGYVGLYGHSIQESGLLESKQQLEKAKHE
jgi:hypothetical protein